MIYGLGLLALCLAWLLPGHYFPWRSLQQETVAAVGALLVALAVLTSTGLRRLPLPWIASGAAALAAVPLLQWALGQTPFLADAALPALYLCAFALCVIAASALVRTQGKQFVAAVFASILVAAIASTWIGLVQWLQLGVFPYVENLDRGGRVYANFTQPNHLATMLALGVTGVVWLFETRRIGHLGTWLALSFLGWGLVMTQSRTGWTFVAMLVVWWALAQRRAALRTTLAGVAAGAGLFAAMTALWSPLNTALDTSSTTTAFTDRVQAVGGRAIHWPSLWDAAWREPWLGWGWMRVGAAQQAVALDHPRSHEWVSFSHNLMLDLLVWNGVVIGFLVVIAILWWIASRCYRCHEQTSWCLLAAGGAVLNHSLVEFPYAYTYFLLPLAMFVGAVEGRTPLPGAGTTSLPRWIFGIAGVGMAAALAWIGIEYLAVEDASNRASFKEAGYVTPGREPVVPDVWLLDNQREFIWFRLTEARPGMSDASIDRMRQINQRFMPPPVMLRFALATGLNGRPEESRRNLQLICQMWRPRNCDEGRKSWKALQGRFPTLRSIEFPEPPAVAR